MSGHLASRHHPYRRTRRSGGSSGRHSGHRRHRQPTATQTGIMGSDVDPGGCIDLTANDTLDDDVIDLTDSTTSANYSAFDAEPVVVISPADVDNADAFRRETVRHRPRVQLTWSSEDESEDGVIDVELEPTPSSSSGSRSRTSRGNNTIDVEDLSDEDLPDPPFNINGAANGSLNSPESVKISCPVCMDSADQIRRNRQLYSTTCGHIFCSACIRQAIDTQHMCPTCRKRLTKRQIHQIYL